MTSALPDTIVILHAFGPYARGEMITEPATIAAILSGGHAAMVVRTNALQHLNAAAIAVEEH